MRTTFLTFLLAAAVTTAVQAQNPPPMGQGGRPPMPDHWMTMDSLVAAVGITAQQKPEVAKHYDELNAVMKKAADERAKMRQQMAGQPPTDEQRQAFRAKLEPMQTELEAHYKAIRGLLTPEQQAKFDALPAPRVVPPPRPPSN